MSRMKLFLFFLGGWLITCEPVSSQVIDPEETSFSPYALNKETGIEIVYPFEIKIYQSPYIQNFNLFENLSVEEVYEPPIMYARPPGDGVGLTPVGGNEWFVFSLLCVLYMLEKKFQHIILIFIQKIITLI